MTTPAQSQTGPPGAEPLQPSQIDPMKLEMLNRRLRDAQNLSLGFLGGLIAASGGAVLWAVITVLIDFQIGWMAVGVGFLVGYTIRALGQGVDKVFGFMGAGLALLGCLMGNFLAVVLFITREEMVSFMEVLLFFAMTPIAVVEAFRVTFSPIDLLFYAIALYEGYKFSIRYPTADELKNLAI